MKSAVLRAATFAAVGFLVASCGGGDNKSLLSGASRDEASKSSASTGKDDDGVGSGRGAPAAVATSARAANVPAAAATPAPAGGNTTAAGSLAFSASTSDGVKM